jgi:hypothetical protein
MEEPMTERDHLDIDSRTDPAPGGTAGGGNGGQNDWIHEDDYWRANYASRPYVHADLGYEFYQAGYRFGFEAAKRSEGRPWNEVENELRSGWGEYRAKTPWEMIKDAVRDAWDKVIGRDRTDLSALRRPVSPPRP